MIFKVRLAKSLFFILFVFIYSISAQQIYKIRSEKSKVDLPARRKKGGDVDSSIKENDGSSVEKAEPEDDESASKANAPENAYSLRRGRKEVQIEYGISPFKPTGFLVPRKFDVSMRKFQLFSVRFGRIIGTKRNVTYEYLFGVTPFAVFTKNEVTNPDYVSAIATPNVKPTKRATTYAVAFQPINFRFIFLARNRLKPYAQAGAGLLFANADVPVPYSKRFNFTGDFGGGLMYMLSEKRAVNIGYKYFHISNGNIGGKINNPGYNANVFYVNYSFFRK